MVVGGDRRGSALLVSGRSGNSALAGWPWSLRPEDTTGRAVEAHFSTGGLMETSTK